MLGVLSPLSDGGKLRRPPINMKRSVVHLNGVARSWGYAVPPHIFSRGTLFTRLGGHVIDGSFIFDQQP
jgi:hypothetical protein